MRALLSCEVVRERHDAAAEQPARKQDRQVPGVHGRSSRLRYCSGALRAKFHGAKKNSPRPANKQGGAAIALDQIVAHPARVRQPFYVAMRRAEVNDSFGRRNTKAGRSGIANFGRFGAVGKMDMHFVCSSLLAKLIVDQGKFDWI